MSDFNLAIDTLLSDEGGVYVPDDHGRGPSKWGITLATAREYHPAWQASDIQALNRDQAVTFYGLVWGHWGFGKVANQRLATSMFNIGSNVGYGTVIKWAQKACGVPADGVLGPITAAAINNLPASDCASSLLEYGSIYYNAVISAHPEWAGLRNGWIARLKSAFLWA